MQITFTQLPIIILRSRNDGNLSHLWLIESYNFFKTLVELRQALTDRDSQTDILCNGKSAMLVGYGYKDELKYR